jgi:hypothetical protein
VGVIGWAVGGRVDAVDAALVGGALTGAGLGAVQWWAAKGALGRAAAWIGASAVGYAVGLAAGAALVGYDTDLGSLAIMGFVSGAVLGGGQGVVLARQGRRGLALPWAVAMPVIFALGWCAQPASASTSPTSSRCRRRRRGGLHAAQWAASRALRAHPQARRVMDAVDHVVLGTGAVGMAVAEALLRRGESVRVVNRCGLRAGWGSAVFACSRPSSRTKLSGWGGLRNRSNIMPPLARRAPSRRPRVAAWPRRGASPRVGRRASSRTPTGC